MRIFLFSCAVSLLVGCGSSDTELGGSPADWPNYGGSDGGGHYSAATQITVDNVGSLTLQSRQRASALGIVINGLPILNVTNVTDELADYYRDEVIIGPGAFTEIAEDFDDFARAFLLKLRREITPALSRDDHAPRGPIQLADMRRMIRY